MIITSTELQSYSGDDFTRLLTFTDSTGRAVDISNYTLYLTIKEKYTDLDADAAYSATLTNFTDPTNGKTTFKIPHASTELLDDVYLIDVKYKDGSGTVGTALNGRITFYKDVSQRASL